MAGIQKGKVEAEGSLENPKTRSGTEFGTELHGELDYVISSIIDNYIIIIIPSFSRRGGAAKNSLHIIANSAPGWLIGFGFAEVAFGSVLCALASSWHILEVKKNNEQGLTILDLRG